VPTSAWSTKRQRQYEHIRDSLEERGRPDDEAEDQLYDEARQRNVLGSKMSKAQLEQPLGRR